VRFLPTLFLRAALPLLLLGPLSGCAVYDAVFHPHRLPTPKMDAATKAKVRAAEKARHKGLSIKTEEAATSATDTGGDGSAPSVGAGDEKKKTMSYSDLPEGTRIKYDKQGLVKKSMLDRVSNNGHKLHHYDTRPLTPREASRENRKIRKKGHTNDHGGGSPAAPRERADAASDQVPAPSPASAPAKSPAPASQPDPAQPAPAPAQPAAAPAKKQKASKVPVPKPDPTQPAPGQ
jgi:hypothetical protein